MPSVYQPLSDMLAAEARTKLALSLPQIEQLLQRKLPRSAYTYYPWWSNYRSQPQGRAWLDAGWVVDARRLADELVDFRRR